MKKVLNKIGWFVFGFLAIGVGLYPTIYFIKERTFGLLSSKSEAVLSDALWNIGFYTHIILGGLALLIGWVQFSKKLRARNMNLHRTIGKIYVISVLLSGVASLYIAFYATGGLVSIAGFFTLGVLWLYTTMMAYRHIKAGDVKRHQIMMIYSYAICFAAVTLRLWLPLLMMATHDFVTSYRIVAWLCWVPNVLVAFFLVRRVG